MIDDSHRFCSWMVVRPNPDPRASGGIGTRGWPRPPGQSNSKVILGRNILAGLEVQAEPGLGTSTDLPTDLQLELLGVYATHADAYDALALQPARFHGALHVALISFSATDSSIVVPDYPPFVDDSPEQGSWPKFAVQYWDPGLATWPLDPAPRLGAAWKATLLQLIGGPPDLAACKAAVGVLKGFESKWDDEKVAIVKEAWDPDDVIAKVLTAGGIASPGSLQQRAWRGRLRRMIEQHLHAALYFAKGTFSLARPFEVSLAHGLGLNARFCPAALGAPATHPLFPGHPSYPSGHASLAYTWAFILERVVQDANKVQAAKDLAQAVAHRREVAGLHYPFDSAAGERLARFVVGRLWLSPGFQDLARNALV